MQHTSVLHTNQPTGSGEEDIWRVFIKDGSGDRLGHVNQISPDKISFSLPKVAPPEIWLETV